MRTKGKLYFILGVLEDAKNSSRIKVCVVLLDWNGGTTHHDLVPQASQDTCREDLPESLNWSWSFLKIIHHPSHPKFIRMICLLLLFFMYSTGSRTTWESSKFYWLFITDFSSLGITFKYWMLQSIGYPAVRPIHAFKKHPNNKTTKSTKTTLKKQKATWIVVNFKNVSYFLRELC